MTQTRGRQRVEVETADDDADNNTTRRRRGRPRRNAASDADSAAATTQPRRRRGRPRRDETENERAPAPVAEPEVEVEDQYVPSDDLDVRVLQEVGEALEELGTGPEIRGERLLMQQMRNAVVSESSINAYGTSNSMLIGYILDKHFDEENNNSNDGEPQLVTDCWIEALADLQMNRKARQKRIKEMLKNPDPSSPPIHFENFTPSTFIMYLLSCSNTRGERLSKNSYYAKRAGLFHLYRSYKEKQSEDFQSELSTLFKGLLRTVAEETQSGNGKITTGKMPLPFDLYAELCQWMMEEGTSAGTFAHLFLVLSWNLACRSSNTKTIHHHHMGWVDDAMKVYFAHMKNDQSGERPRDPRHMYANPFDCRVCPVLAVIMYFLVYPPSSSDSHLFPGSDQYNRYQKFLRLLLESKREYIMQKYGLDIDEIGAHSSRKGASTYMTSGVVGGPGFQAVNIRCGWKMPGVTDTYARYEAAGDMYCGRVLSGLPLISFKFGVLPPKFIFPDDVEEEATEKLHSLVRFLFPGLAVELWPVITYGLAALALKETWLREKLAADHILFQSTLFMHPTYQYLKPFAKVELGVGDEEFELNLDGLSRRTITGIPAHVVLLSSQRNLAVQQQELVRSNEALPGRMVSDLEEQFQNLALNSNSNVDALVAEVRTLTEQVTGRLDRIGDVDDANSLPVGGSVIDDQHSVVGDHPDGTRTQLYYHNGRYIQVPPDFVFPKKCNLKDIFIRLHIRDTVSNIPALKRLNNVDVKHIKRESPCLSDLKYLMTVFEHIALEKGKTTAGLRSLDETVELFGLLSPDIYSLETKNKKRRTQFSWQTWVKKCRDAPMPTSEPNRWT